MNITFAENIQLDRSKWLSLLGVTEEHLAKAETDEKMGAALERLQEQMDEAEQKLIERARPAFAYSVLERNALDVRGESLAKHLESCDRIVISAATLGQGVDELISETQNTKIALSVVIDCGASLLAVVAADIAMERIREDLSKCKEQTAGSDNSAAGAEPLFMTERFSPGYGDSPLEMQTQLLELLDAERQLGITLSKGYMMSPSKSITGIMGLADHPVTGRMATCDECVLRGKCRLLKEGKRCYD